MPPADEHTDEQKLAILIALLQKKPQLATTMKERIAVNRTVEARGQVFSVSIMQQALTFRTNEAEVEALLDKGIDAACNDQAAPGEQKDDTRSTVEGLLDN